MEDKILSEVHTNVYSDDPLTQTKVGRSLRVLQEMARILSEDKQCYIKALDSDVGQQVKELQVDILAQKIDPELAPDLVAIQIDNFMDLGCNVSSWFSFAQNYPNLRDYFHTEVINLTESHPRYSTMSVFDFNGNWKDTYDSVANSKFNLKTDENYIPTLGEMVAPYVVQAIDDQLDDEDSDEEDAIDVDFYMSILDSIARQTVDRRTLN